MVAVAFIMLLEYYKPDQMNIVCCECMHACVCVFEIVYWHFIRHYLHCGVYHLITNVLLLSTRHVEKQKLFGLSVCLCVCVGYAHPNWPNRLGIRLTFSKITISSVKALMHTESWDFKLFEKMTSGFDENTIPRSSDSGQKRFTWFPSWIKS